MTELTISVLGHLQVTLNGEPITDFATDKAQALLAYLAAEADRPHHRDALVSLLWPDQPQRKARHNLRQAIHGRDDNSGGRGRFQRRKNTARKAWPFAERSAIREASLLP